LATYLASAAHLRPLAARALVTLAALLLGLPFALGALRVSSALGSVLAQAAFPSSESGVDLAAAPRRALLVTLELAILFAAGAPLVALSQPFLPAGVPFVAVLVAGLALLAIPLWRSARNLQGHVRAGTQVIVEALARQGRNEEERSEQMQTVRQLLPGIGETTRFEVLAEALCVGRSLKELDLRGLTGATVLAVERGSEGVILPSAGDPLREHDVLLLTGTQEAVGLARALLSRRHEARPSSITDGDLVG
jgi:monovalent cation:H+ antiporter-2, CPA2 family